MSNLHTDSSQQNVIKPKLKVRASKTLENKIDALRLKTKKIKHRHIAMNGEVKKIAKKVKQDKLN